MRAAWWWIDRWRKSTARTDMNLEERGAYRELLDECWLREGVIPDNEEVLVRILACSPAEWGRVKDKVLARFQKCDGGLRNETADEVMKQSSRRAKNQKAYRDRQRGDNVTDNAPDNEAASPSPDPSKEPTTTESPPSGGLALKGSDSPDVRIFEYWRSRTGKARAQYTPKKRAMLRNRWKELKGTPGERETLLKQAVDGAVEDPFFSGAETGTAYLDFDSIFRNGERVEKLLGKFDEKQKGTRRKKTVQDKNRETIASYKRAGE